MPKKRTALLNKTSNPVVLGILVVLFTVLSLLTYKLYVQFIIEPEWSLIEPDAQLQAQSIAVQVNNFISQRQQKQSELMATLSSQQLPTLSKKELRLIAEQFNEHIADSTYSYIITSTHPQPRQTGNFVALDIGRQILAGEQVFPQAMKHNGEWRIIIATPSSKAEAERAKTETATGAIISNFAASAIKHKIQSEYGKASLIQNYTGSRATSILATKHSDILPHQVIVKTENPHWTISFKPAKSLLTQHQPSLSEYALYYTCLGITCSIILWLLLSLWLKSHNQRQTHKKLQQQKLAAEQAKLHSATSFLSGGSNNKETTAAARGKSSIQSSQQSSLQNPSQSTKDDIFDLSDKKSVEPGLNTPANIFRAYDIRGIYNDEINEEFARDLGLAFGSLAQKNNQQWVAVARDGRVSGPSLYNSLLQGLEASGCNTIEIGQAPTPLLNFALTQLEHTCSGISVTASHNPAEYTGFKMILNSQPLTAEEVQELRHSMLTKDHLTGQGERTHKDVTESYIDTIANDIEPVKNLHVVVDASNGATGPIAPLVFEAIGCQVSALYCDVDGTFPNHEPDTAVAANLHDLIQVVCAQEADLGIALDGDGDRVVAVTATGKIVWPDELMMIFSRDILTSFPQANIVFDIKSTSRLAKTISSYGGHPVIWKTGHSNMRSKIQETQAPLGGEYSGHLFFNDRWGGFDDGIYGATRLMEILSVREQSLDEILATLPQSIVSDEYKIEIPDDLKFELIDKLVENAHFEGGRITTLDGLRVDFDNGWGLVRASNTTPALTLRFEGTTQHDMENIASLFKEQLLTIDPTLTFTF